jgi:hypothetical protein
VFFLVFLRVIMAPYLMAILRSSCRNNGEAMTKFVIYAAGVEGVSVPLPGVSAELGIGG